MDSGLRPVGQSLTQSAEEFCHFLMNCTSNTSEFKLSAPSFQTVVFMDEFCGTILPPNTVSCFTEFTGAEDRVTVIFSQHCEKSDQATEEGSNELDLKTELESSEVQLDPSVEDTKTANPFTASCYKSVKIGQLLSSKRVFLSKTETLHGGQSRHLVTDVVCAHDSELAPLTLDKARYLCSLYALGCRQSTGLLPTIWAVCLSEGQRKVVGLGCSFDSSMLHTFSVQRDDTVHIPQNPTAFPGAEKQTTQKRKSLERVSGWVFSEYEISSSTVDENASSDHARLALEFAWSDPENLLSPPPESADAVLKISATPGYMFSPILAVYQEITTLLSLCQIACRDAEWPSQEGSIEPTKPLAFHVEAFLEDAASPLLQPLEVTVISPTADHNVYEPRTDLDFTERLWVFAKEVQSLTDLQQVFAGVFKAVLLGKVQPFLHRSSSSMLATLFRQVLLSSSHDERQTTAAKLQALLSEDKVLNCLVEIGIEKLQRDHRSFLIGSDLATGTQLDHFFEEASGDLMKTCHYICKLHNVMELNASALSFLNLPTSALSSLTKIALEIYKVAKFECFETTPVFALPIPAYSPALKSVASLCANLLPKTWILSAKDEHYSGALHAGNFQTVITNCPLIHDFEITSSAEYVAYKTLCKSLCL